MKYTIFIIIFFSTILFVPSGALAEGSLGDAKLNLGSAGARAGTAKLDNIGSIAGRAINIALTLLGLVFLILMVYAGYLWMIARGEEEKVKKAQKIIIDSLIGLVIVISAYAITFLVMSKFGN
ncbi:MAG: hypothetical protein WC862_03520 [Patescibacteria group bacterium]